MKSKTLKIDIDMPVSAVAKYYDNPTVIRNLLVKASTQRFRKMYYLNQNLYLASQYSRLAVVDILKEEDGFSIYYKFERSNQFGTERYRFKQVDDATTELIVTTSGRNAHLVTTKYIDTLKKLITEENIAELRFVESFGQTQVEVIRKKLLTEMIVSFALMLIGFEVILYVLVSDVVLTILSLTIALIMLFVSKELGDKVWFQSSIYSGEQRVRKSKLRYLPWVFLGVAILGQLVASVL